jgi:hypothetical protein
LVAIIPSSAPLIKENAEYKTPEALVGNWGFCFSEIACKSAEEITKRDHKPFVVTVMFLHVSSHPPEGGQI